MGTMISYNRPDGQSVAGYLAEPAQAAGAPGIVVIQEWWGLNDQIKGVADKLAAAGYRALVPDLYRGKVALEANEAEHLMTGLNFGDAAGQDVRGAVQHLKATGSAKVGVTGFCMGGALTMLSAVNVPEADAAVVWYGVSAARVRRRVEDQVAADGPLCHRGRGLPDRQGRRAGAQASRRRRPFRVPPLPREARLRQRDGRLEEPADAEVRPGGGGARLAAHDGVLLAGQLA